MVELSKAKGRRQRATVGALAFGILSAAVPAAAQVAQGAPPPPTVQQAARAAAPIDMTGTWASVVTEDWQWRFVTPIVGDYTGVPLNAVGNKLARSWNHDADLKAGEQCKAFGAAAITRLPTRLQISWADDNTMKLDFDLGTQSRLVYFDKSKQPAGAASYQGHAIGEWIDVPAAGGGRGGGGGGGGNAPANAPIAETPAAATPGAGAPAGRGGAAAAPAAAGRGGAPAAAAAGGRGAGGRAGGGPPAPRAGGLRIVTTNLRAQYLRQNGVPVSEKAVVTDYLDIVPAPDGSQWLVVKTMVDDPAYLSGWYIVSSQFKKEANNAKWNPTPCELLPRLKGTATQVPRQGGD
jgi:hypothetical protein